MSEGIQKFIDDYEPYLNDLWKRIYHTAFFFAAVFFIGFFSSGWIIQHFIGFFHLNDVTIAITYPFQLLDVGVDIALFLAFACSIPVVLWHLYFFLRPAVSKVEFKAIWPLIYLFPLSALLFAFGFIYGFFSLYIGLQALASINTLMGLKNIWDLGSFLSQLITTATLLGVIFQFPIVLKIFISAGILKRKFLTDNRRVAYAIIIIGVSILPPTDGISLIIMSLPLCIMYELTILLSRERKLENAVLIEEALT
jgi:sec-independent protein translocase protein TatC